MSFPILDNHIHLRPSGRNVSALKEFQRAGGTHAILVHLPYEEVTIVNETDFWRSYDITIKMAQRARNEISVRIEAVVGPYPVLLTSLSEIHSLRRAVEIMKRGMEIAAELVKEQKAIGIGEIGRPHFHVSEDIRNASNEILFYGMQLASDIGCPVILHTESATPEIMKELAEMADKAGLPREKVVKHYCPPLVLPSENHNIFPSILASRSAIIDALKKGRRFVMETDYLDDTKRPSAVMSIVTVPKRCRSFLQAGIFTEEDIWVINKENPEKIYGISIE
ncbi:MAG: TatD family hydrolase [Methanomassiliicoccales archaeon]